MIFLDALTLAGLVIAVASVIAVYWAKGHCRRYGGC